MDKAIIKLGYECNNNCLFCHAKRFPDSKIPIEGVFKKIETAKSIGATEVILSGGEPTIRRDIFRILRYIKKQGLLAGMVSNGRMFSSKDFLEKCCDIGLSEAFVSLHSHKKDVHDRLSQAQAFEQTVQGIRNLRSADIEVILSVVVNKMNCEELNEIVGLADEIGAGRIKFASLVMNGAAVENKDLLVEKISRCAEASVRACSEAEKRGIKAGVEGFALCLISGRSELCDDLFSNNIRSMSEPFESEFYSTDYGPRTKPEKCKKCRRAEECFGIDEEYLKLFGDCEIRPFS
jgi:MoaA/NifB/PqqE/SkfB family radical SAM enzyme